MTEFQRLSLMEHLCEVPDPRMLRTQRHELLDILAVALCAVIGRGLITGPKWSNLANPN